MSPDAFKHYKTGIPEFDEEHWETFVLLKKVSESENLEAIQTAAKSLRDHLFAHLESEEEMMERENHKFYTAHKREHVRLREEFNRLVSRITAPHYDYVGRESVSHLSSLFCEHITWWDLPYGTTENKLAKF
jgi:hemerythrin-like metal-binding protein